jgi:hypothetical protein
MNLGPVEGDHGSVVSPKDLNPFRVKDPVVELLPSGFGVTDEFDPIKGGSVHRAERDKVVELPHSAGQPSSPIHESSFQASELSLEFAAGTAARAIRAKNRVDSALDSEEHEKKRSSVPRPKV